MAIFTNSPKTAKDAVTPKRSRPEQGHDRTTTTPPEEIEYVSTPNLKSVPEQEQARDHGHIGMHALDNLVHQAEASVATLTHASENVENGGLKLLLKVMAAIRAARVKRLRTAAGMGDESRQETAAWARDRHITDGMTDIQASMSVRREERQHLALYELAKSEAELIDAYDAVLGGGLDAANAVPGPVMQVLEEQRAEIQAFHGRLSHLDEERAPLVVARVYDSLDEAKQTASELHRRGLARNQVDILPMAGAIVRAAREVTKPAGSRSTVIAGAVTGGIVGGVIGLAAALYVMTNPEWIGWVTVGPLWLFLGTLLPSALMGAIFGWIIGRNRKEDDLNVAIHHMQEGECLVAAYPSQVQMPMAEDVLGIKHARSLGV